MKLAKTTWEKATVVAVVAVFYITLEALGVTCPVKFLTGVSCAGCGMSRAWLALLRLDFAAAFHYHPLVLVPIPAAFFLLFRSRIPKRVFNAATWFAGGLFILVYLIRLAHPNDVVVIAPQEGAIWRLVSGLLGG